MSSEVSQVQIVTKAPPWHGWVTADLFLLSLASGTFTLAALFILLRPIELGAAARTAFCVAFPLMLADIVCLIFDLGDPARFHHMLRVFKPGSPMSVGVWTISVFSFVAFLAFAAAVIGPPDPVLQILAAIGLVPALIVGAYKGILFSVTAQPAWRRMRWLGAAFALSSTAMGAALMLALASFDGDFMAVHATRFILMWLLVLNGIAVRLVMGRAGGSGHLSEPADRATILRVSLSYTFFIVVGLAAPLVLCAFSKGQPVVDTLIAAIVLTGALIARHYLVMLPHRAVAN
ncbi:MAG: NrfD/PsrC family molybdoenzyme membrane anchor subunit [Candidatus Binataceae bacterium]